jgi:hypothetical protein
MHPRLSGHKRNRQGQNNESLHNNAPIFFSCTDPCTDPRTDPCTDLRNSIHTLIHNPTRDTTCIHCEECKNRHTELTHTIQCLNDRIHELNKIIEYINIRFNETASTLSYIS